MKNIDIAIYDIDKVICKSIENNSSDLGYLSQSILSHLRNYVEHIGMKYYFESVNEDMTNSSSNIYNEIQMGIGYFRKYYKLNWLKNFHELLQQSVSHYTFDEDRSERLFIKYYDLMLELKEKLKKDFEMDLLQSLYKVPLNIDSDLKGYYHTISQLIGNKYTDNEYEVDNSRYYIEKTKPFVIENKVYYEITFRNANDKTSKYERLIGYSKHRINTNYAVKFALERQTISYLGIKANVIIINDYEISIRPCEFNNFAKILDYDLKLQSNHNEYKKLMKLLKEFNLHLLDIVLLDDDEFNELECSVNSESAVINIFNVLRLARRYILTNKSGANVLRYLLFVFNNRIIRLQLPYIRNKCYKLSNLILDYKCVPFDQMPFTASLKGHNPNIYTLLQCIEYKGREYELLVRKIQKNTLKNKKVYTIKEEIEQYGVVNELIDKYNNNLYYKHRPNREIHSFGDNYYLYENEQSIMSIIKSIKLLSNESVEGYSNSVEFWLNNEYTSLDCKEKKEILLRMFSNSKISMVYGAAGTGKSTLINHICNFFYDKDVIVIANTNTAVDDIKRKIKLSNIKTSTISKFLYNDKEKYDLLIIDEAGTVSNKDMNRILENKQFELLLIVDDNYQIESIDFGNWFEIAKDVLPKNIINELTDMYRTKNDDLLYFWKSVREKKSNLNEIINMNKYSTRLDESIFNEFNKDEIILCLNYDGIYGINNINRLLQANNKNDSVIWGVKEYKVGDPILFNETNKYSPILFNNLKGSIIEIHVFEEYILFDLEINKVINELDIILLEIDLISSSENSSVIRIRVEKSDGLNDDDNDSSDSIVPFQVSYAISIHKAQGLEFNSVKIVISDDLDEQITNNIFYTAITRARENLKIYWSPRTEKKIIDNIISKRNLKDLSILKSRIKKQNA